MITIRPSAERGLGEHGGWLKSLHTFSFANYHDPRHMGFRALRVINEDRVTPGAGFDTHGHRDMEIVTYVLDGAIEHKDSLGTGSVIRPGEVQRMSAGTGIAHSEYNHSRDEPVHFLQIWIMPEQAGLAPGYEQRDFPAAERSGRLRLVAARDGRDGALTVHQDVGLYSGLLAVEETVTHALAPGRHAWLQVARGAVSLNGQSLVAGDGAAASDEARLDIAASEDAEVLLFDLA
jgi:redox-sensitive bicupin YhaK (pirin superfamily)